MLSRLSHQSTRHSKLCNARNMDVKNVRTQNKQTNKQNNSMSIMSRRESRFFEEMNCGVRRLIHNSPSNVFCILYFGNTLS